MDDAREEMRKLIDVIEKGAKSTSVEQAVDDIKLFANTASFLANALIRGLRPKTPSQRVSQNPQRLWGNQNHRALHSKICKHTKGTRHHNWHAPCHKHSDLTGRL
jgi:hypothetical protein